jgi:hypothetical protein
VLIEFPTPREGRVRVRKKVCKKRKSDKGRSKKADRKKSLRKERGSSLLSLSPHISVTP